MNFNIRLIVKITGVITIIIAVAMLPAALTAFIYHEGQALKGFMSTIICAAILGLCAFTLSKPQKTALRLRDGYLVVALSWLVAALIGSVPYIACGHTTSFVGAFFEATSGFTTTGATVLDISSMPNSLMMWRAICHWLGGMGILVFAISVLPALGIGGQRIFKAESSDFKVEKTSTRISDYAKILYLVYISLTISECALLLLGGLSPFDAIITTLASVSTGGMFTYPDGLSYFDNFFVEITIAVFTILSSIGFVLYIYAIHGRFKEFFTDLELRVFLGIITVFSLLVIGDLYAAGVYDSLGETVRYGFSQVLAFASTSGYIVADYNLWPDFTKFLLFALMFVGGCAASTSGSIKVIRVILFFKLIARAIYKKLHPRAVVSIRIGDHPVSLEVVSQTATFICAYVMIFIFGSLVLSLQGFSPVTTISASAAMLSNTGIVFGDLGATGSFAAFNPALQLFMCLMMVVGRLEIFTIILLFIPSFWNSDKAVY